MPTMAAFLLKVIPTPPFYERPALLASSMGCRRCVCQVGAAMAATRCYRAAQSKALLLMVLPTKCRQMGTLALAPPSYDHPVRVAERTAPRDWRKQRRRIAEAAQ